MSITTVVFDFGNVIGFFSHHLAARNLAALTGVPAGLIYPRLFGGPLEDDFERGRLSTPDFLAQLRRELGTAAGDDALALAFSDMFTPNPETCGLVSRLRGRCKLVLLSNTNDLHFQHFTRQFADTLGHFDAVIASHQVGVRKPEPGIYRACEEAVGVTPGECVFIDDLPANVEAARARGWRGLVYRPGEDLSGRLQALGVGPKPSPTLSPTPTAWKAPLLRQA